MSKVNPRELPEWMNVFINTWSKNEALTKQAEVNVKDLPKIVWNEETFYVMFDDVGATVINEFGNTVTTIKEAFTIDAVDQHLNGKQIVSNKYNDTNVLEAELAKVSTYLNTVEAEDTNETQDSSSQNQQVFDQPQDQTEQEVNELEQDIDQTTAGLDLMAKFADMEIQMQNMQTQINSLQSQLYAYTNPGNVYDLNTQVEEQKHFEESAVNVTQQLNKEHNVDLTTMQGRVSLVADEPELTTTDDSLVELELPEFIENNVTEDVVIEEISPEEPIVEEPIVEEPIVEEPIVEDVEDNINKQEEDLSDAEQTDDADQKIVKLTSRDTNIFKERICPNCGNKKLTLANKVANMQGIYCAGCLSEYGVNMNTEVIYKLSK